MTGADKDLFNANGTAKEPAVETYVPASDTTREAARKKLDDPEALYRSLVRALRRRKGFGILFLQCTPAKGQELFPRLQRDLARKNVGRLTLTEPIENLYRLVEAREDVDEIGVLFIEGIQKSLTPYLKSEVGRNDYYKLEVLPPILNHLNRLRENFRQRFPNLCFVFVVPPFAVKYFMYRAIDFFAWNSGVWRFNPDNAQLQQETTKALSGEFQAYEAFSEAERREKIASLQNLIDLENQSDAQKAKLLEEQGLIFTASEDWVPALRCFEQSANLQKPSAQNWFLRGFVLDEIGDYEEAIASYEAAIAIKPDYHEALNNKGYALVELGRYEEAIASYESAVAIKPDYHEALNNKGYALVKLGRYEEAIASYELAVVIKPDYYEALNNKGNVLVKLGCYKEAIASYDLALAIKPALHAALYNKGNALVALGRYEEASTTYELAIAIKPDFASAWYNKACCCSLSSRTTDALVYLQKAAELDGTDKYVEMAKNDTDFEPIRNHPKFQALLALT